MAWEIKEEVRNGPNGIKVYNQEVDSNEKKNAHEASSKIKFFLEVNSPFYTKIVCILISINIY